MPNDIKKTKTLRASSVASVPSVAKATDTALILSPNTGQPDPLTVADYAVVIGRFQPFHLGHLACLQQALSLARRVIVLIGSHECARSPKNPFTTEERSRMIRSSLPQAEQTRVTTLGIHDAPYNDQLWFAAVQQQVDRVINDDGASPTKVTVRLVGHRKDDSSYYLGQFPQWQLADVALAASLNATDLRERYFSQGAVALNSNAVCDLPMGTHRFLEDFAATPHYQQLAEESRFIAEYRAQWAVAPYPPTFVTVDAVVVEAGYVLLVKRKFAPGKGLWALPGGFVNAGEWLQDAVLRELKEETRLKVPAPVLRGSIKSSRVFDSPTRSQRGRTITHAYLIELEHNAWTGLHDIRAGDDAQKAQWVRLADFYTMRAHIYEDHFDIVTTLLSGAAHGAAL